jgi:hypothetical protein
MSVNGRFGIGCLGVLALSAIAFAAAKQNPQGQYQLSYSPVAPAGSPSSSSLATYSPIKSIDGRTIQLRGEDGVVYVFTLTPDTIYCQSDTKVADWSYLRSVPKKNSVTVLISDEKTMKALVVWDQPPTITTHNGQIDFSLPTLCK